ncbi:C4-dicarboxylate ABC transporter permease [Chromatiales bacterium (ex Bugula neritina AB1)]|nr:C4-dicarboxylate ABC transporter permease [Chromatiales bacterium (ex Bugula neritina AB1)]
MAYLGGAMLLALIVLTCVSVIGRSLNGFFHTDFMESLAPGFAAWTLDSGVGPVNGDFELIEAGVAFAIFAFLPLCQITGSHASVELLARAMSPAVNRILQFIIDVLFALVLLLIAVQLFSGMQSKMRSGQTTLLLEFPIWWAYAVCLTGAAVAAIVAIYIAIVRAAELAASKAILPSDQGELS